MLAPDPRKPGSCAEIKDQLVREVDYSGALKMSRRDFGVLKPGVEQDLWQGAG